MSASAMILKNGTAVSVFRNTPTKDSSGGNVDAWTPWLPNIKVFVQDRSGNEQARYNRETGRRMITLFALSGQDIRERDQIRTGTRTLNILTVRDRAVPNRPHLSHLHIEAEETK